MSLPPIEARDHGPLQENSLLELDVIGWRFECLVRSGYPVDLAIVLAETSSVDLHDAVELVKRGCPVRQAAAILL